MAGEGFESHEIIEVWPFFRVGVVRAQYCLLFDIFLIFANLVITGELINFTKPFANLPIIK